MRTTPRIIISFAAVILSFFIFPHISSAQEFDPIPLGDSLDLYVGTWKYENTETGEVFIVKLKKFDNFTILSHNFGTVLIGEYSYKKNGITIYDNIDSVSGITTNNQAVKTSILCTGKLYHNNLSLSVSDKTYYKAASGKLSYSLIRNNVHTLTWKIAESEGDFDVGPDYKEGLSIPSDIVLIKVEE